jgi:NADH-quinone oxidoreductase subunit I
MTEVYEFSEYNRNNLIYSFSNMTEKEISEAKERLVRFHNEQASKKAAAASKPAPPPPQKPGPHAQQTGM